MKAFLGHEPNTSALLLFWKGSCSRELSQHNTKHTAYPRLYQLFKQTSDLCLNPTEEPFYVMCVSFWHKAFVHCPQKLDYTIRYVKAASVFVEQGRECVRLWSYYFCSSLTQNVTIIHTVTRQPCQFHKQTQVSHGNLTISRSDIAFGRFVPLYSSNWQTEKWPPGLISSQGSWEQL